MLFITLGDGPGPSPRPASQPNRPRARRSRTAPRPCVSRVSLTPALVGSCAPTLFFQTARLHALRSSRRGLDRADRARLLVAHPFFVFAQSFYYFVSYFAINELSHFTYVNKSFLLLLLSYFCDFSTVTQSFCDHVNHFATLDSTIFW
jgi:hypothetical protein